MQKYKFPATTIHKVVCNKCGMELENKRQEPQQPLINDFRVMLMPIPVFPIDFTIEDEKISFHCNTCHNEDDFKIITLGSTLHDLWQL